MDLRQLKVIIYSSIVVVVLLYLLNVISILASVVLIITLLTIMIVFNENQKENPPVKTNLSREFEELELKDFKECPTCKTENIINRKYCKKCGNNIQNIVCPVCQHKNSFDSKYCSNCDSILQNKVR